MKNYLQFLGLMFLLLASLASSAQVYAGGNNCLIRIEKDQVNYDFDSRNMEARLNEAQKRLEFIIPVASVTPRGDTSTLSVLYHWVNPEDVIIINARLPDDKVDYAEFKGNVSLTLAADLILGNLTIGDYLKFIAIHIGEDNIEFNFEMAPQPESFKRAFGQSNELLQIQVIGKGEKIVGVY